MAFYVSLSSRIRKSRIHLGNCLYCRNGSAIDSKTHKSMGWSPALSTLFEAEAYAARMLPKFNNTQRCDHCLGNTSPYQSNWFARLRRSIASLRRKFGAKAIRQE